MIYDIVIMRTIIDLPDDQVSGLAEICKIHGISRAEAVRRAVTLMLESQNSLTREEAFGAWSGAIRDSQQFVQDIRKEWDK
jgi:metal-responsive CopG/Arc/MetJ family transcriptional regulator